VALRARSVAKLPVEQAPEEVSVSELLLELAL